MPKGYQVMSRGNRTTFGVYSDETPEGGRVPMGVLARGQRAGPGPLWKGGRVGRRFPDPDLDRVRGPNTAHKGQCPAD